VPPSRVKFRRTSNGLAGVVNDEIQSRLSVRQMPAKSLNAGRAAHVQSEDLKAVCPFAEIGFPRVALRRVAGETRRDNEMSTCAKELQTGLIANFHAPAGE
jgi:hypothetical protein